MENKQNNTSGFEMLKEKIKDIRIAMLTSITENGSLHSRPMFTHEIKEDGVLWFFTGYGSSKSHEIKADSHVSLGYANPEDNVYVAVSGRGTITKDKAKIDELWNESLKAWFPEGKNDPNVALLKVTVDSAEYWDSPDSKVVQLVGYVKATLTGEPYRPDNHGKINM